jgi:PAS domain S-box-containing protein
MRHAAGGFLTPWTVRLGLVVLGLLAVTAGIVQVVFERRTILEHRRDELASILALKVRQISDWRGERLADARFLSQSLDFAALVERYRAAPSGVAADAVTRFVATIRESHEYVRLIAYGTEGKPILDLDGADAPAHAHPADEIRKAALKASPFLGDLHRGGGTYPILLDLWVPLRARGPDGASPVGVLLMSIDPRVSFFPRVREWPTPSATGETLLVRRDGEEVLYLNDLRHRDGTALSLRFPLSRTDLPAVRAVLQGPGTGEGTDYRGRRVLAAWCPVEGTGWSMVCKVDWSEIATVLRRQVLFTSLVVILVVGIAMLVAALFWRGRLREREERLRAFFVSDMVGTLVGDVHGGVAEANDEYLRIIGRSRAELAAGAIRWDEITPPEFLPLDEAGIAEARQRGFCTPYEKQYLRPDGSRVWVLVGYVLLGAERERSVAFILDISRRKAAEEEVRALTETLEQRVRHRTGELERANRELESFAYSVSHDLRSPLRAIDGFARILDEEAGAGFGPDARHHLDRIRANAQHMDRLIDDLLALSRTARQEMKVGEVDLSTMVRTTFERLAAEPGRPAARLELGPLPRVRGDGALLEHVVANLLDNALKFSSRAQAPCIAVAGDLEGGMAVVRVRDNGVGFDMNYAGRLFGVFQRLHVSDEFPGSGVGLAIVQRIVQRHGGDVSAESAPGQGAVFTIRLPSAQA